MGGLFSLRPCFESVLLFLGVVGRAQWWFPTVRLHALNPLSTHNTMLLSSPDPEVLKDFIQFVHANVSKEIRKLHDLPHRVFEGRPHVIPVAQDLASEEARLRYSLAQGTKEHLVQSPREVPFVTGVHALERGVLVKGVWFDRTAEYNKRRSGEDVKYGEFATEYPVVFSPLPSWQDFSEAEWRPRVTDLIHMIERDAAYDRELNNIKIVGAAKVMAFSPLYRAPKQKRSRAPIALAATKTAFKKLKATILRHTYEFFVASSRLRSGVPNVEFPVFSFPPGQPMVIPIDSYANGPPSTIFAAAH